MLTYGWCSADKCVGHENYQHLVRRRWQVCITPFWRLQNRLIESNTFSRLTDWPRGARAWVSCPAGCRSRGSRSRRSPGRAPVRAGTCGRRAARAAAPRSASWGWSPWCCATCRTRRSRVSAGYSLKYLRERLLPESTVLVFSKASLCLLME